MIGDETAVREAVSTFYGNGGGEALNRHMDMN